MKRFFVCIASAAFVFCGTPMAADATRSRSRETRCRAEMGSATQQLLFRRQHQPAAEHHTVILSTHVGADVLDITFHRSVRSQVTISRDRVRCDEPRRAGHVEPARHRCARRHRARRLWAVRCSPRCPHPADCGRRAGLLDDRLLVEDHDRRSMSNRARRTTRPRTLTRSPAASAGKQGSLGIGVDLEQASGSRALAIVEQSSEVDVDVPIDMINNRLHVMTTCRALEPVFLPIVTRVRSHEGKICRAVRVIVCR